MAVEREDRRKRLREKEMSGEINDKRRIRPEKQKSIESGGNAGFKRKRCWRWQVQEGVSRDRAARINSTEKIKRLENPASQLFQKAKTKVPVGRKGKIDKGGGVESISYSVKQLRVKNHV